MSAGVVVTGPGRSGTSMVAGLFAAHGVFFGHTKAPDRNNPRGYFEHPAIPKPRARGRNWPETWWDRLRLEGWADGMPWGAKQITSRWRWLKQLGPSAVVICLRPAAEIRRSWARTHFPGSINRKLAKARLTIRRIHAEAGCPVITVHSARLIRGDYTELLPAFRILGIEFDDKIAEAWIDPTLWGRK